jgi:hypothetical protein
MRIASVLSLLYFCASCMLVAIILSFGLPQTHNIKGPNISYVPFIVGVIQLAAALFYIHLGKRVNPPPLKAPGALRWVLLIIGLLVLFCGYVILNMSIFTAYIFGSKNPVPQIGVVSWLVMSVVLAALLYFASRMNSIKRPNLFRYFALTLALVAASLTTIQSLILIYAVPSDPPAAFSFLSAILTLAFLPFAFLLLGLSKDYIGIKKAVVSADTVVL